MLLELKVGTSVGVVHSSPAARSHKQSSQAHAPSWAGSQQAKAVAVVSATIVVDAAVAVAVTMPGCAVANATGGALMAAAVADGAVVGTSAAGVARPGTRGLAAGEHTCQVAQMAISNNAGEATGKNGAKISLAVDSTNSAVKASGAINACPYLDSTLAVGETPPSQLSSLRLLPPAAFRRHHSSRKGAPFRFAIACAAHTRDENSAWANIRLLPALSLLGRPLGRRMIVTLMKPPSRLKAARSSACVSVCGMP
jgi:hypothetical protein